MLYETSGSSYSFDRTNTQSIYTISIVQYIVYAVERLSVNLMTSHKNTLHSTSFLFLHWHGLQLRKGCVRLR